MADAPQVNYAGPWPESDHHSDLMPQQKWDEAPQVYHGADDSKTKHAIMGLQRRNFLIISLLALVLVGAIIGGSVGGVSAVQKKNDSYIQSPPFRSVLFIKETPQNIKTDTTYNIRNSPSLQGSQTTQDSEAARASLPASTSPPQSVSANTLPSTVSFDANAAYTPRPPSSVAKIDTSCPPDLRLRSWTGETYKCAQTTDINGKGDITGLVAYTLQACVDACSTLNRVQSAKICVAVAVNQMLAGDYSKQGANCYLKNITGPTHPGNTGATFLTLDQ